MILAAGFGTRLLPHTLVKPKPLFPLLNKPLLLLTVQRLQKCGFDHIMVNCHHLGEQIEEVLCRVSGVTVLVEKTILGTGGGLRNALPHMRNEPLLVTNGDIYHTIDFADFYRSHSQQQNRVTLAMHDYPRFNSVSVSGDHVADFGRGESGEMLAFTGLHVIEPFILEEIEPNKESCIIGLYKKLLKGGQKLCCTRVDDSYWTDMGTPEDYLKLHEGLLTGNIPCWEELQWDGSSQLIHPEAELTGTLHYNGWCSIGRVIAENVTFEKSVIWDNATLLPGGNYRNCLISNAADAVNRG